MGKKNKKNAPPASSPQKGSRGSDFFSLGSLPLASSFGSSNPSQALDPHPFPTPLSLLMFWKQSHRTFAFLILLLALGLRTLFLLEKPFHFDEGINGWFGNRVLDDGYYNYDPHNYHGPLHFFLIVLFELIIGHSDLALRMIPVFFSILTVWLILSYRYFIGQAAYYGALFFAISPGAVFYGRYCIHEAELVFFLALALWGLMYFVKGLMKTGMTLMAFGVLGAIVTKETWTLYIGISLISYGVWASRAKVFPVFDSSVLTIQPTENLTPRFLAKLTGFCLFLWALIYSSFFRHPQDLLDFFAAYMPWLSTGVKGNGHEKPFYYWLDLLVTYEWPQFVALLCLPLFLFKKGPLFCFALTTGLNILIFSLIPYKTPWLILTFVFLLSLMAGGLLSLGRSVPKISTFVTLVFSVCLSFSVYKMVRVTFFKYDDPEEKYAYVQTFRDYKEFVTTVQKAAERRPGLKAHNIPIYMGSEWPLPWHFDTYTTSFLRQVNPEKISAPLVVCDKSKDSVLRPFLSGEYFVQEFKFRGAMEPTLAYYRKDYFAGLVPSHIPLQFFSTPSPQ